MEEQLADEKLCALLVATDFTEGHGTGPVPVGLTVGAESCDGGPREFSLQ